MSRKSKTKTASPTNPIVCCSFCFKPNTSPGVAYIVQAPGKASAICDKCVLICAEVIFSRARKIQTETLEAQVESERKP